MKMADAYDRLRYGGAVLVSKKGWDSGLWLKIGGDYITGCKEVGFLKRDDLDDGKVWDAFCDLKAEGCSFKAFVP